jgi:hypothetical protein
MSSTNDTKSTSVKKQTLTEDLIIRSIKMVDIGYITVLYFLFAFLLIIPFNEIYEKLVTLDNEYKSTEQIFVELILHIWFLGIAVYIARNLIEKIPFPLDGYRGFKHDKVKELHSATVFTLIFFYFQTHMRDKIGYLYKRVMGKNKQKKKDELIESESIQSEN